MGSETYRGGSDEKMEGAMEEALRILAGMIAQSYIKRDQLREKRRRKGRDKGRHLSG